MSPRLTNKRIITDLADLPEMRGLAAFMNGRRAFRDGAGHGGGPTESGDDTPPDADDTESDDDDSDEEDEEDDDKKSKSKKDDNEDDEETVPKWKYDKAHKRMQAADRTATDLKKQIDDLKASRDVSEDVKRELAEMKSNVDTLTATNEKLTAENRQHKLKFAALSMKDAPEWEDADVAFGLLDLSDVDIDDETGKIDKRALRSALKTLAREKAYLVKKKSSGQSGNEGDNGSSKMNGGRRGQRGDAAAQREALKSRFPVLNR